MISLKEILIYLKSVVRNGVDDLEAEIPEDDPIDNEVESEYEAEEVEQEAVDGEEEEAPKLSRRQTEIIKLRKERQDADAKVANLERELNEVKVKLSPNTAQQREHELAQQENAILNNPEASDWQKYAVRGQQEARRASAMSQAALYEARDLKDKTDFQLRFSQSQPKAYAAYESKVEAKLKEMRDAGGNVPPRSEIFKYLVGQDVVEGKLKSPPKKSDGGAKRSTPNARSDVRDSGSSGLTDSEKRIKRLENIRI